MIETRSLHPVWYRFIFLLPWLMSMLIACQPEQMDAPQPDPSDPIIETRVPSTEITDFQLPSSTAIIETKEYFDQEQFVLINEGPGEPSKQNLWVALISDVYPYQTVSEIVITPENYRVFTDEYDNQIAEFDLSRMPAGTEIRVQINYLVRVNRLSYDLSECEGELLEGFTSPELHIESNNPQIIALADQLSEGNQNVCEQARAFFDHIGDNLVYSFNGNNWGAQAALGEMGADCTEYASLMIALSRAADIPARYLEGVLFLGETSAELARTEHAWLEVYLPGTGWTPMDPTLGRSPLLRDQYFAAYTPDHIIVTQGRHPSALRGRSYWTHLYWPGDSTTIRVEGEWKIEPVEEGQ
jgi:transglutaminase-like putative cysteine protease